MNAAARPRAAQQSEYQPMQKAPKDRLILIKIHFRGPHVVAVTGQYDPNYGGFCTLALGHHIPVVLSGHGWMDIPEVRIDMSKVSD